MIKLLKPLNKRLYVAASGGVDSMALLDFVSRKHKVGIMFFNHGTQTSQEAEAFLYEEAKQRSLPFVVGHISTKKVPKGLSQEEHWRNERYFFFSKTIEQVITAHTLDDCVETWVWSSLHGKGKLIPLERANVLRPVLTTEKNQLVDWCLRHNVKWIEDKSNADTKYMRNYIRHEMMPHVLHVNPGIKKTVKKMILESMV